MKTTLALMAGLVFAAVASRTSVRAADAPSPNIVFIFADDLGWGDVSCHGAESWLKTPRIDRLAAEGIDFLQFNVLSPVCSPSRAAAMTGRYPSRYSIRTALHADAAHNRGNKQADWLDPRAPMLPRYLKTAGYHTAHIGKWHLGEGAPRMPDGPTMADYGFDETRVYHGPGPKVNQRGIGVEGARAIERMKDKQPFFLNVWLHETHARHFPTQDSMDACKHLDPRRQVYAATLRDADNEVGLILDALKQSGLEQNTLVMFSSDNGPAGTAYSGDSHAPTPEDGNIKKGFDVSYSVGSTGGLRGRKASLFEGGVRVPFIVRWPGRVPAGLRDDTTVFSAIDLLPTLCAVAGVKVPDDYMGDGENLLQALLGHTVHRTKPLLWIAAGVGRGTDNWCQWSMREGRWKLYADGQAGRIELYDLTMDRAERNDVSKENVGTVTRMRKRLLEWVASLPQSPDPACVSKAQPSTEENASRTDAATFATPPGRRANEVAR
jgi:N-acetylgalactosamine-6-sulfatase